MKQLKKYIKSFLDDWAINRFKKLMPVELIKSLYQKIAKDELVIDQKIINVKKGKRKYTLLIVKDKSNKTVFNLQRHSDQEPYLKATN